MSNNQFVIDHLMKEREALVVSRDRTYEKFCADIQEIETAIEKLAGKKIWEFPPTVYYDDESPDYIKGSQEEL